MEVHHHPHVPHGPKPFKEYFLEFVMIFLAVSMGFIAENIRESISDHSKEHEYITGLIENLSKDTVELKAVIKSETAQIKGIDSIRHVTKSKLTDIKVQDSLFMIAGKYLFYANNFKNDDITLTQLRSTGGYRLIKSNAVVDSISSYESRMKDINDEFTFVTDFLTKTRDVAAQIFDVNLAQQFFRHKVAMQVLTHYDKDKIDYFFNQCYFSEMALDGYRSMLREHLVYTRKLIKILKKEYDM